MFGFLKNLIKKPAARPEINEEWPALEPAPEPSQEEIAPQHFNPPPPPPQTLRRTQLSVRQPVVPKPAPIPYQASHQFQQNGGRQSQPAAAPSPAGRMLELPLAPILAGLPLEVQPRIEQPDVGDATVFVPLEKVLSQLARGTVKITFGELRQAAPGVFSPETDRDKLLVPLPLNEILDRLNPALITRRRIQKKIEVPAEVCSPFDANGNGQSLIFSVGPGKPEAGHAAPQPPAVARQHAPTPPPATQNPAYSSRGAITSAPTPQPPSVSPPLVPAMIPSSRTSNALGSIPMPAAPHAPTSPAAPAPIPMPHASGPKAAPEPPQPAKQHSPDSAPLVINLIHLAEGWPEPVRKEVVQANMVEAKVELPNDVVEQALRQGRLAFSWKTVRSWIRPTPVNSTSPFDNTVVELPLKVVAPLFLDRQKAASKENSKVHIDEEIPNLFFGFPQPSAPPEEPSEGATATVNRPVETNYYVWDDSSDTAHIDQSAEKRGPGPATRFVARYATPNEVVSRAAALEGVAGALIALPDGLLVASHIPQDLNGDTLAAFLPQIFAKMTQCTKELRMGELNNLNFTVGNIPWKIFRVNAIFFAALGRIGEALPTAQLAALAAELDHKPK